jgi:hypothetical protein
LQTHNGNAVHINANAGRMIGETGRERAFDAGETANAMKKTTGVAINGSRSGSRHPVRGVIFRTGAPD